MDSARRRGRAARLVVGLAALVAACVVTALVLVLGVDPEPAPAPATVDAAERSQHAGRTPGGSEAPPAAGGRRAHGEARPEVAATLRGVVRLYRTREPVAGLTLTLSPPQGEPLETVTTDEGAFRFSRLEPAAGYELSGRREPYAAILMTGIDLAPKEQHDLGTLWLEVAVDLDVEVRDLTGEPLEGAEVAVFATGRAQAGAAAQPGDQFGRVLALTSSPRPTAAATTDAQGAAVAAGLLPGNYHVRASAVGHASASRSDVLLAPDAARRPVRLLLSPAHSVEGTVRDTEGEPVVDAQVIAAPQVSSRPGLDRVTAQTDAEGLYALRGLGAGRHALYLAREGLPLLQVGTVGVPDSLRFDIRLRATATIVGTVTGPEGEPIADAEVSCAAQGGLPLSTRTDEAGTFEIPGVPAGQLQWFRVAADGFVPHPDPSAPQQGAGESLRDGVEMRRDVQLQRGITVAADVRAEEDGSPIAGAQVRLMLAQMWGGSATAPASATTDDEGKATISGLLAGDYLAVVEAADFVQEGLATNHRALLQNPQAIPERWRVSVDPGVDVQSVELRLSRGAVVSGRVLGPDDAPVAGARVTVTGSHGDRPAFSGEDGGFRVEAVTPSRRATASATAPGLPQGTSDPFVVEPGATIADVEVRLAGAGRVSGVVRSSEGSPLRGAVVRYVRGHLNERNAWSFRQFDKAERHAVGPDGRFEITGVAAGEITVRADAENCLPAWDATVEVLEEQESGGIDLILSTAAEMTGRVEGPGGSPVAGATVSANFMGTPERRSWGFVSGLAGQPSTQSDPEGRFTLRGLKPGMYQLWATAREFRSNNVQTETGAGEVLLTLAEGMSIAGVVKDAAGGPLGGVPVRATQTNAGRRVERGFLPPGGAQVYSAPDGSFEIRNLAEGAYDLTVSGQWIWGREVNVQDTTVGGVSAGRDDVEIVVAAGQTIEGVVLDDKDDPVGVGWISARFEAGSADPGVAAQRWNRVLPDGTFRIVGLQPGTYTLQPYGSFQADAAKGVSSGRKDVELRVRQGFTIQGWITNEDGLSLRSGVSIRCRVTGTEKWEGRNVVMPGDGSFAILGLEDGAYDLRLSAQSHAPLVVPKVSTGTQDLVLVMVQGVSITGRVVDAGGLPVKSASVAASQLAVAEGSVAAGATARTAETGTFELRGLVDGDYRLLVRAANLAPAIVSPVGGGAADLRIVLEAGVSVSGVITTADEQPLPNARLRLLAPDGQAIAYTRSRNDGTFEFQHVPSQGRWKLTGAVWVDGRNVAVTRAEPVESGDADVAVRVE